MVKLIPEIFSIKTVSIVCDKFPLRYPHNCYLSHFLETFSVQIPYGGRQNLTLLLIPRPQLPPISFPWSWLSPPQYSSLWSLTTVPDPPRSHQRDIITISQLWIIQRTLSSVFVPGGYVCVLGAFGGFMRIYVVYTRVCNCENRKLTWEEFGFLSNSTNTIAVTSFPRTFLMFRFMLKIGFESVEEETKTLLK